MFKTCAYCGSTRICDITYSSFFPRIGFVFIVNTDDEVDGANDAGVALWRAFNYISKEHDVSQAFISMTYVSLYSRHNFIRMYSGLLCITIIIIICYFKIPKFIKTIVGINTDNEFNSYNTQLKYIILSLIYKLCN